MLNLLLTLVAFVAPAQPAADLAPQADTTLMTAPALLNGGAGSWAAQPSGTIIIQFSVVRIRLFRARNFSNSTVPLGIKVGGGPTGRQIKTQIPPNSTYWMILYPGETVTLKALGIGGTSDGDWRC